MQDVRSSIVVVHYEKSDCSTQHIEHIRETIQGTSYIIEEHDLFLLIDYLV